MGNEKKVKGTKQQFCTSEEKTKVHVRKISCLNERQVQLKESIETNEITITIGLAGSGKTFVALHTALSLLGGKYKKIILVKSVTVLPEEEIGFIPGDMAAKMEPFMISYLGNLRKLVGDKQTDELFKTGIIEVLPLAYIRGLSIDNSIVIVDEAQNLSNHIFKSIITRIGSDSKYIFMGDIDQIDRKDIKTSCLQKVFSIFSDYNKIGTIEFTHEDCVRNPIIPEILEILKQNNI